jgi:hypothetical protein
MRDSLSDRLLRRELQDSAGRSRKVRSIYGDKNWVRDLDIVNELDGHSGCVNALRFDIPPPAAHLDVSDMAVTLVGPSQVAFLPRAPMISISISTPTSPTIPTRSLNWPPASPPAIEPTSSPSSSCLTQTIVLLSRLLVIVKSASLIWNTLAPLQKHHAHRPWL